MKTICIISKKDGITLLQFLAKKLDISKKKAKKLIDTRNVLVNRQRIWITRHKLNRGDKVEIILPHENPIKKHKPQVLFENNNYLIVNKTAGILSNGKDSIESCLRIQLKMPLLTAAHRLDKDTTGCLLLAKNQEALQKVISLFRIRHVKKTYHAISAGQIICNKRTITIPIDSQCAITHMETLDANKDASHLLINTETGRTHQIRKHLAILRHPVLGDRCHGTQRQLSDKLIGIARQMLHASKLMFHDPYTGDKITTSSPLPSDFRKCLKIFNLR
ncbi:pseudouridine synthase [Verrucomicrobiota bacterium]